MQEMIVGGTVDARKGHLGKNGKFLPEELVCEVHCCVQDACDGCQNLSKN